MGKPLVMLITFHEMLREDNDDNNNEDKDEKDEARKEGRRRLRWRR